MMTKLREFSAIFLWILVFAFLGLMVFEWGMDFTGMNRGAPDVGVVNGEKLTYEMFSELYQQAYQNEKARQDKDLDENAMRNLRNQVWEQFVQRVLFKEEMERLNIAVSDSEIVYQIKHYPLEEIKNNPNFQTDGEFDWNKYYQSFNNPNIPWYEIEQFYRNQLPFVKLQNIITSSVRVSEIEIKEDFIKNNINARAKFIEIPFSIFNQPDEEVTPEQIQAYYTEHIEDYKQDEKRKLKYVAFSLAPTAADTARMFRLFDEIKERVNNGEDFNELALIYSEDPEVQQNRGLYDYFEKGAMVKPFEDACFNGKIGTLIGPVQTRFGYHLIRVEDKRIKDGAEQVKASHILLTVSAGPSTRESQSGLAGFFAEDARSYGFDQAAENNQYKIETTGELTESSDFVPGFGRNYSIIHFAFNSELNEISDVIETDMGFTVFELSEIIPEGPKPVDQVESIIKARIRLDNTKNRAKEFAQSITTELKNSTIDQVAANNQYNAIVKIDSTEEFTLKRSPRNIGYSPEFNAKVFALQKGQVTDMIETSRGLIYASLLNKSEFDSTQFQAQYNMIRQKLLNSKRNEIFTKWYEHLKAKAKIEDNRKMFNI